MAKPTSPHPFDDAVVQMRQALPDGSIGLLVTAESYTLDVKMAPGMEPIRYQGRGDDWSEQALAMIRALSE